MPWPWRGLGAWWRLSGAETQVIEDVFSHRGRLHLLVNLLDLSLRVDHEGVPHHPHVFAAHELFKAVTLIGRGYWAGGLTFIVALGVAQEGEWEGVFIDELAVALGVVFADAKNTDAVGFIDGPLIAEIAGLLGAPRSVIFGIEIDDDPLTA